MEEESATNGGRRMTITAVGSQLHGLI